MMKLKFALFAVVAALAGGAGSAQALPAAKAAGAAQTVAGTPSDVVQVRRGGGRHNFHGGMDRHRFHHRHHHWRGPHLRYRYWGPSIRFYGGYNRCGWLRQRAVYSGSSYWWHRYNACRYGW